jgi:prepilin-type N-terminal cleavage/methylation domain-containing protein
MSNTRLRFAGATLMELIVVLAIIGLAFAIVGVAMRNRRAVARPTEASSQLREELSRGRRAALRSGTRVIMTERYKGDSYSATAWPDGRVVGDSVISAITGLDPLTGRTSPGAGADVYPPR